MLGCVRLDLTTMCRGVELHYIRLGDFWVDCGWVVLE